jgi:hypothetical protein
VYRTIQAELEETKLKHKSFSQRTLTPFGPNQPQTISFPPLFPIQPPSRMIPLHPIPFQPTRQLGIGLRTTQDNQESRRELLKAVRMKNPIKLLASSRAKVKTLIAPRALLIQPKARIDLTNNRLRGKRIFTRIEENH